MAEQEKIEVSASVRETIEQLLNARLANAGLHEIRITGGEDFQGEQALFIDASFALMEPAVDPAPFTFLTTQVREAIEALGEQRFPHLRYHFHEQQKVAGWR